MFVSDLGVLETAGDQEVGIVNAHEPDIWRSTQSLHPHRPTASRRVASRAAAPVSRDPEIGGLANKKVDLASTRFYAYCCLQSVVPSTSDPLELQSKIEVQDTSAFPLPRDFTSQISPKKPLISDGLRFGDPARTFPSLGLLTRTLFIDQLQQRYSEKTSDWH